MIPVTTGEGKRAMDLRCAGVVLLVAFAALFIPQLDFEFLQTRNNWFALKDILFLLLCSVYLMFQVFSSKSRISLVWLMFFTATGFVTLYNLVKQGGDPAGMLIAWLIFALPLSIISARLTRREKRILALTIFVLGMLNLLMGLSISMMPRSLVGMISNTYSSKNVIRPFGIIGGPGALSNISVLLMGVTGYLWIEKKKTLVYALSLFFMITCLYMGSRTGFLISVLCFFMLNISNRKVLLTGLFFLFLMVAYIVGTNSVGVYYGDRLKFADYSTFIRMNALMYCRDRIIEDPITGFGPGELFNRGSRKHYVDTEMPEEIVEKYGYRENVVPTMSRDGYIMPTEPHNTYALVWVEYGIIGLLMMGFVVLYPMLNARSPGEKWLRTTLLILFLFSGLSTTFMYAINKMIFYWAALVLFSPDRSETEPSASFELSNIRLFPEIKFKYNKIRFR